MHQQISNPHTSPTNLNNPSQKPHQELQEDLMTNNGPNESSLSIGFENQTKIEQNGGAKRNAQSPTSSHCVENDHPTAGYDFENHNLT